MTLKLKEMFKGISTFDAYEQCLKRGFCEKHIKEVIQNELAVQQDELPRKTFLFIRVNILYTLLFKKSSKCEKIKILLQRTPVFSRILAEGDASQAIDAILTLDSVVIFTLCQLSKICCIGALFQKNNETSEDPDRANLQKLLLVDRFEGKILSYLQPLLQKNFAGFDLDLIKLSYVVTLLFVRNYCVKLNIKTAIETIEEDLKGGLQWENFKNMGDIAYQRGKYKDAFNAYSSAVMLNSYSSVLFNQRAQTHLKLGNLKAAQLDAFIAVIIDPKSCEGYYAYSSSLFHQKLYQDAYNVAKYGLEVCESNGSFYETLQTLCIEIEMKYLNKESSNNISEKFIGYKETAEKPIPEKKYFPVLVDSDSADSESEDHRKTVPELVETSDSDEGEPVEKKPVKSQTKTKTKKKRIPLEVPSDVLFTQMDMIKIHSCLKEASEAILSDCGYKAVQIFRGPLRDFIDSPKLNTFDESEVVCIKYAYGIAYCKSGGYDDLLKCITILKEIVKKHESITFPAAYYALGLANRKLNRFKEALNYLETVQSFLCKGIHFKVYPWPEIPTVIQETKSHILKVLVADLIKECENPPNPEALCRFSHCSYQPTIYYSDPDFKGYISLLCSEQCCLQYHLQCWKTIKMDKKLTDKEFLEQTCFTPDCDGVIIKVQNIDKKGDITKEFTSDFKKAGKQKWAKWEKKTDVKEKKKKRSNSRSEDGTQEVPLENGGVSPRKNSDANGKFIPAQALGIVNLSVEKDSSSSESVLKSPLKIEPLESDVSSKCSYICSSLINSVCEKNTERSESSSILEAAQCLSISKEGKECNNVLETPSVPHVSENECSSVPKATSLGDFQNEMKLNTKVQEHASQYSLSECIRNNVYSYMYDYLQHRGPLRTDDPVLTDELSSFPEEVITMIAECGGIGEFLKNDLRFAFVGDTYICVVSDLAKAYRMNSNSSLPADLESLQSLEGTDNSKYYNECDIDTRRQSFGLNPDAVEYTPVVPSVNSYNTDPLLYDNDSVPKNLDDSKSLSASETLQFPSGSSNKIHKSLKDVSKSCDTALDSKLHDNAELFPAASHSEHIKICGDKENKADFINEHICEPKLNCEGDPESNANIINYNQNSKESNESGDSSLNLHGEIQGNFSCPSENLKIKKMQAQLLPLLREYCDESFSSCRQYIDICLKPYKIRKLPETATTGTETDFENTDEVTSTEQSRCLTDSLNAQNKELEEQNLTLKDQLVSATKEIEELSEEVSKLKTSLNSSSFDLEVLKIDYRKKEEALLSGREYLLKSLTDSHKSIDEHKKRIELLEIANSRFEKTVCDLSASLIEAEENMENAVKAENKKHCDIIKNLQKENCDLKNRVKYAEIRLLETKKAAFLERVEDRCHDVSKKKQEFTQGLSMFSGNLNPMVQSSMKNIFSQFSCYLNQLNAHKLDVVKKIDEQIEKVEKGASLQELDEIETKIPDPPHLQNVFPEFNKNLFNPTQMAFNLLNGGSFLQIPSAAVIPQTTASSVNVLPTPPSAIIPPVNSSTTVIKPSPLATVIPQAKPVAAAIPSHTAIIPQAKPAAAIIPQATPCATIIPQATPCTKISQPTASSAAVVPPGIHSVLSSVIPAAEASQKKCFDVLNSDIQEPLKNPGISMSAFSSIPYSVPTLDKEFNKTCAIFRPPDLASNNKLDTPKVPPGILNRATNVVSSISSLSSSRDSLETFPIGDRTLGSMNLASKVTEPVMNSSEQGKKKTAIGNKTGSSYDKLLMKLKEQFPSYNQEELISIVKEFRSQRKGKLTGLPIDAIISELKAIIKAKKEAEKRIYEQKAQPKPNKVLVNKKLVPDLTVPVASEQQQSVKKKSAWGTVDSDSKKTFSGNADDDCTICCDPMTPSSAYKVACGHAFHEQCIRLWLKNKSNCPVCRVLLLLPEEYPSLS